MATGHWSKCQWIESQGPSPRDTHYCNKPSVGGGKSYCEDHVWLVYKKGTKPGQGRKMRALVKTAKEFQSEIDTYFD